ncbi:deoxynucleoside kinase, partial [Thauera sp.]|uniref:deoxynucleoside kinase n=1 Tax=Thauera sp. TaxID=1905334 RepID=UPI0026214048
MLDKARYIVVEGPIGAGKTSLARRLAERLQAEAVLEQAELNPFLTRFYQQSERWGLATQLSFLFQRIDQLASLGPIAGERRVVADFLFDKDRLFAEQNLSADELALYRRVHDGLQPADAPRPDLVIYL